MRQTIARAVLCLMVLCEDRARLSCYDACVVL